MLIVRQLIGNIKESALPYVIEQLRLAKLSFDLFGALSPTEDQKEDEILGAFETASDANQDTCTSYYETNGSSTSEVSFYS